MDTQQADTHSSASSPGSPTIGSQAKARMRLDTSTTTLSEVSHLNSSPESLEAQPDAIALFPTNIQPLIDTILKDMLMSLQSFLQSDMLTLMQMFNQEVITLGARVKQK